MTTIDHSAQTTKPSNEITWNEFWFLSPDTDGRLRVIRLGFAVLALWYFVSHFADVGLWFSQDGILASERLGLFLVSADLANEAQWRVSPLYWLHSTGLLRGFLVVGIMLAIATFVRRSGRVTAIGLWLCCLWLANRSLLIDGAEELVLCFGLMYLAISSPHPGEHWLQSLSLRLIQVHTTLLIAITGMTMLASEIWWDGTGSISLAAPNGRRWIDLSEWLSNPTIHEPLTHFIVAIAIAAPVGLWIRRTRLFAYGLLIVWSIVLAILSSQWLYFLGITMLIQSFATPSWFRFASAQGYTRT